MEGIKTSQEISRRNFLKGAVTAGAVASLTSIAAYSSPANGGQIAEAGQVWDASYDVIIIGAGFAGLTSAITVKEGGANVVIVDSAPEEYSGGNSRVAGQLVWSPTDPLMAKNYYLDINHGYTDDIPPDMIDAFINEASQNVDWIEAELDVPMRNWPYPEYAASAYADAGKDTFCPEAGMSAAQLWDPMTEYTKELGIEFLYEHEAIKFVLGEDGVIAGVEVDAAGSPKFIEATKAVVMCCGGFENNVTMLKNFAGYTGRPIGSPFNKGQGIKMCQSIGADLWHMPTVMTQMYFDYADASIPEFPDNAICVANSVAGGGPIWLDKYAKRFINESRHPQHGLGISQVMWEDANNMETPRIPLWIFADDTWVQERGLFMSTGWIRFSTSFTPSRACEEEIAKGWVLKADSIEEMALKMEVDAQVLQDTVDSYNEYADNGNDAAFGRAPDSMRAFAPPYYAISVYPGLLNTDGGPRRDAKGRIIDVWGEPIPHLYSAGEMGSIWAHHYQGAGNVSECLAFGRIVGHSINEG